MTLKRLPTVPISTDYVKFIGGLDLETPVLSLKPGFALEAMNYEPGPSGGYRRIDGFERFDGRPSPSSASYLYGDVSISLAIAVGNVITGATSGATGTVIAVHDGAIAITKVTGTFQKGETINVAGNPVATWLVRPTPRSYRTGLDDAIALAKAADLYRADIGAVPGAGAVLGVNIYKGTVYAFRNKADNSVAELYKGTGTGWTKIDLGEEIGFSNANASVGEGDTLTQGGITATIKRVVLQTGTLASGTNTGRLILSGRAGGNYAAGAATATGGGTLTLSGAATPIVMQPGGRFEFVNTNFSGSTDTYRMYGCDGKNRAFEFDGTVFVPITTGMADDRPLFIAAPVHSKKLFLAFKGSVQNSGDGNPYVWTVTLGANEVGLGEEITGMLAQPGEVLAIFTRNSTYQLVGKTIATFQLNAIAPEVGAIGYTAQNMGVAFCLDDRGIMQIKRTEAYGNFNTASVSEPVQKIIDTLRGKTIGSTVYRARNQYRIYGSDGSGLIMTVAGNKVLGFTQFLYPVKPTCFCAGEDATGKDVVFFGADNGYVYQADRGSSFDGQAIEAYLRLQFNNLNSPRHKKRYRKAVLEISATAYSAVRFQPEFTYGDPDTATHRLQTGEVIGAGGYWNIDEWETFFYDARIVSSPEFSIEGSGLNMGLLFYSNSAYDLGHTVQGMLIHYTTRKLQR